eukprot:UN2637
MAAGVLLDVWLQHHHLHVPRPQDAQSLAKGFRSGTVSHAGEDRPACHQLACLHSRGRPQTVHFLEQHGRERSACLLLWRSATAARQVGGCSDG